MFLFDRPVLPETDHIWISHVRLFENIQRLQKEEFFFEEKELSPNQIWKILRTELGYHVVISDFVNKGANGSFRFLGFRNFDTKIVTWVAFPLFNSERPGILRDNVLELAEITPLIHRHPWLMSYMDGRLKEELENSYSFAFSPHPVAQLRNFQQWGERLVEPYRPVVKNKDSMGIKWEAMDFSVPEASRYHISVNSSGVVKNCYLNYGFHTQAVESKLLDASIEHWGNQLEKWNPSLPQHTRLLFCHAVETLFDVQVPERAKALRMILVEFERIFFHFDVLYRMGRISACRLPFSQLENLKNEYYSLINIWKTLPDHRKLISIGGVSFDPPLDWMSHCLSFSKKVFKFNKQLQKSICSSSRWMNTFGKDETAPLHMFSHGLSGPVLRSSGVNFDLRLENPLYFYPEIDFKIPLGIDGSCYDLALVRIFEAEESSRIIAQLLENVPSGSINSQEIKNDLNSFSFDRAKGFKRVNHFSLESPRGELGIIFTRHGSHISVALQSPSECLFEFIKDRASGYSMRSFYDRLVSYAPSSLEAEK